MELYKKNKILTTIVIALTLIFFILLSILLFVPRQTPDEDITTSATATSTEQIIPRATTTPVVKYIKKIPPLAPTEPGLLHYIEIVDSCGPFYDGTCVNMRSGPGLNYSIISRLRNGVVLQVGEAIEHDDQYWYKVILDEWIRYPERVTSDWYVSANYTQSFFNEGTKDLIITKNMATSSKYILVDLSDQTLSAYDGDNLYMSEPISAGLDETPTPIGTFTIFRKTPSRYMQGPLELPTPVTEQGTSTEILTVTTTAIGTSTEALTSTSTTVSTITSTESVVSPNVKTWDLPGVPWNLYFTVSGSVIHGAYWHNFFGGPASNGCVNMRPEKAKVLYQWTELGTKVIIQE